ncbi:cordon-bleu protein-like 1 isoform X2 [Cololabis saira]|uniref:cordon-bleu protein-like 1 isoform X2 n=1 Tax=Cololabis saira TaxID=129043 RepID=UPI002AD27CD5|nr:cordon-bleu protein-like 1 isoform X2 [Cololabis saira]
MSTEMEEPVSPLERDLSLGVLVPGRLEDRITVHGSKPVMDLLVTLCASYHLNPADYSVEFLSPNKNSISFKPNSPVGALEAEKIVLKLKGSEEKEKVKKPYVPEATVRLLINYNQAHRTVLRVNPTLPLEALLQPVCDKCEFNVETTVLLRDSRSREPLDLRKTLNEHGLREVFARDTAPRRPSDPRLQTAEAADDISPPPLQDLPKKGKKDKSRGFFSLFRRRKKQDGLQTVSAPVSPGPNKPAGVRVSSRSASASNTLHADPSKKRPAPPPPVAASQSVPSDLSSCHIQGSGDNQDTKSAESPLRNTKRRAPPPPCANTVQEPREDADVGASLNPVEELKEAAELHVEPSQPRSSSSHPSQTLPSLSSWRQSLAHLHQDTDLHLPSFRGKDLCDARCALAKVLTSSVSKGALVKRFRNSASFTKFHVSSCVSVTPDNEDVCAELESVFSSNLPTDGWEEPAQRSGLTTFKVVPPTKLTVDGSDQSDQSHGSEDGDPGSQSSSEVEKNHLENKDPGSPDGSEGEHTEQRNDASPAPPPQLHSEPRFPPDRPVSEGGDARRNQVEEEADASENQVGEEADASKDQVEEEADASENQVEEEADTSKNQVEEEADTSKNQVEEEEADASENQVEEEADVSKKHMEEADVSKNQVEEEADASENQVEEEADASENQVEEEADVSKKHMEEEADVSKNQVEEEADASKNQVEEEVDASENQVEEEADVGKNQVEEEADASENQVEEEVDASENQVEEETDTSKNQVEEEVDASKNQVEEEVDTSKNQVEEEADIRSEVEEEEPGCSDGGPAADLDPDGKNTEILPEDESEEEVSFPPPPPPVFFREDAEVTETEDSTFPPAPPAVGGAPADLTSGRPGQPPDRRNGAPSQFAQAVAMAVQRSRLQSLSKGPLVPRGPPSALQSPPRSTYQYGA